MVKKNALITFKGLGQVASMIGVCTAIASADTIPQYQFSAPSPAYIKWQEESAAAKSRGVIIPHGAVPSPTDNIEFLKANPVKRTSRAALPAQFDLRTTGVITPVKDQLTSGDCWAFTTCATLEGSALKQGFQSYDFSEKNLRNRTFRDGNPTGGGNTTDALSYLTRWDGPVLESDDPYDLTNTTSNSFQSTFHIEQSRTFVGGDAIKQALMDVGPLYTDMYSDLSYVGYDFGARTTYYYYYGKMTINHGVTLVGWDDTITIPVATKKGAWLIKNSWGDKWGDQGYFWISYEDPSAVQEAVSFEKFTKPDPNESIYYYDTLGYASSIKTNYGAVSITLRGDETITDVGTYIIDNNTNVDVTIFATRTGSNTAVAFSNPLTTFSQSFAEAGYYTMKLPQPLSGKAGDAFHVVIKSSGSQPLEAQRTGVTSAAKSNLMETFVSQNGVSWQDMYVIGNMNGIPQANMAIKVITMKGKSSAVEHSVKKAMPFTVSSTTSGLTVNLLKTLDLSYAVSNLRGQVVSRVDHQVFGAGIHACQMPAAAGVYIVQLNVDGFVQNLKQTVR